MVLLHGDLLFEKKLLKRLIVEKGNFVLVNRTIKPPKKDFKAVIEKYFDDELCMEIDTAEELEIAERCLDV